MDYEALKEQWSEVEDRDGVRLSWNVIPGSRMVRLYRPRDHLQLLTPLRKLPGSSSQSVPSIPL